MSTPRGTLWPRTGTVLAVALSLTLLVSPAPAQPVAGGDFTFGYSSSFVDILDPLVSMRADGQVFPGSRSPGGVLKELDNRLRCVYLVKNRRSVLKLA